MTACNISTSGLLAKDCMCHNPIPLQVLQQGTGTALQVIYSVKKYAKLCQLKLDTL